MGNATFGARAVLLLAAWALAAPARAAEVGEPAPPLPAEGWINAGKGPPVLERLKGKVVLVEFWFAGCGPCIRAIPHLHEIRERYAPLGLEMVSVARDSPGLVEDFLAKNDFRLPVLPDSSSEVIGAYGVQGFPSTAVIGRDGRLAYFGDPYDCEPAVEKAMGLETTPGGCLTAYFTAVAGKDPAAVRAGLERLERKAVAKFDLRAWAKDSGGTPPAKAGAALGAPATLVEMAKACAAGATERRTALLGALAATGPAEFDLATWARDTFLRNHPLTPQEMKRLLEEKRFDAAVDSILDRRPTTAVLEAAAKHVPLAVHASKNASEERAMGRKGILALHWALANKPAKDNEKYWSDLSVSGMATSKDGKELVGLLLAGRLVTKDEMPRWTERRLSRAFVMDALGEGKKPALSQMPAAVRKETARLFADLQRQYPYMEVPKPGEDPEGD